MNQELNTIKNSLTKLLNANDIKPNTKKAQMAEFCFLQGLMATGNVGGRGIPTQTLALCMVSGRSILSL